MCYRIFFSDEINRHQSTLETLGGEISTLVEKKQHKKDRLKQLQEDCDNLNKNIREKRTQSVGQTTKKNELEREIKELENKHR